MTGSDIRLAAARLCEQNNTGRDVTVGTIRIVSGARSFREVISALEDDIHSRFVVNVAIRTGMGGIGKLTPGQYIVEYLPRKEES